ncbi:sensor histidine kinase [Effusibacillus pohliae]|uniref:sensor histidine kinase n=1 Tax=Effusibacillus pohliae TaxID=232270 RepID=UPI00037D60C2|nr:ATP-binding protein [Effusibacillus pohliae]
MKRSLQSKMAWTLTALAFAVALLTCWILNAADRYHFVQYVEQNRQLRNQRIAHVLGQAYERNGGWGKTTGIEVAQLSELEGVHIHLLDAHRSVIWESDAFATGSQDLSVRQAPEATNGYELVPVQSRGTTVGYAEIFYHDPQSYSQLDWHYRRAMTQGAIGAIFPVLVLSLVVSWYLSRRITRPLTEMIHLAWQMRKGNLSVRIENPPGNNELTQLAQSLNHLADELQKQDKLRRTLTADVAHELRTPLATLKSHLEALIDGIWKPTKSRFEACLEEVERLISLVSSLESLTRAESDSMQLELEFLDLAEVTRSIIDLVSPNYAAKGVRLEFRAEGSFAVPLDKDRWKHILLNLLDNALKYTDPGGTVCISAARSSPKEVLVTVQDTGIGIREEDLPFIFERFYRADKSRNRATGGAGIGLAIVKKHVEAHHGTIEVESQPGKGTAFRIRLPLKDPKWMD